MRLHKTCLVFLFLFLQLIGLPASVAQGSGKIRDIHQKRIDSLLLLLHNGTSDTARVSCLNALGLHYLQIDQYDTSIQCSKAALELAKQYGEWELKGFFKKSIADSYNNMGVVYWSKSDYDRGLEYEAMAYALRREYLEKFPSDRPNKVALAQIMSNIANLQVAKSNYQESLVWQLRAMKQQEDIGDKRGIGISLISIANIYWYQENWDQALAHYKKSLEVRKEINDKAGIANCFIGIGNIYIINGDMLRAKKDEKSAREAYENALKNQFSALTILEEIGNDYDASISYNNIGNIYSSLGVMEAGKRNKKLATDFFRQAISSHLKALAVVERIGQPSGIADCYLNISNVYKEEINSDSSGNGSSVHVQKLAEAFRYINLCLDITTKIGDKEGTKNGFRTLAELYSMKGDFKSAFRYYKDYTALKDSLLSASTAKDIYELNTRYETEKKDKALIEKNAEIMRQQDQVARQTVQRNAFIAGFIFVLVLTLFIYRGYRQKQLANLLLAEKNQLIAAQKELVDQKNIKITDSIDYAQRIQEAIFPPPGEIDKYLPGSFVLLKPKDIVSGDFYWIHKLNDNQVMLAAADCTGHGVPGAFMSIMGNNLLHQIVRERGIMEPARVLDALSEAVIYSLRQKGTSGEVNDGMDIALLKIDRQKMEAEFAGAKNPLYFVRNGVLTETRSDKRSIGLSWQEPVSFTPHRLKLERSDMLYIFSDGYADQKGGPAKKKFMPGAFKQLLASIAHLPADAQMAAVQDTLQQWKGSLEQTDDILVIGIRM